MRVAFACLLLAGLVSAQAVDSFPNFVCDSDSDCFYAPGSYAGEPVPALIVLHCNGALPVDLDTMRLVADSLGWVMASCHATRNRRGMMPNDADIVRTTGKLLASYAVDSNRVFIFGFSGQAVQALGTLFLHPDLFRGVVATCAHRGALPLANWETLGDRYAYLVTREQDWNRNENDIMLRQFNANGLETELVTTPGEHGPGPATELLEGCRWLGRLTAPD